MLRSLVFIVLRLPTQIRRPMGVRLLLAPRGVDVI